MMNYQSLFLENDSIQKVFRDKMNHEEIKTEFKCDMCDYKTDKKELMRQHRLIKHSEVTNKCPACSYSYYFPGKVKKHFQYVHLKEKRPKAKRTDGARDCFVQGCKNTDKDEYLQMGHNKVLCKQCDYFALSIDALRRHVKAKHEGKLFHCNQCDFKSERSDTVNIHKARTHDGEVFRCEPCDLVFETKSSLESHKRYQHKRKHEGELFHCNQCDFNYERPDQLYFHRARAHDGQVYRCEPCDLVFKMKVYLNRHIKRKHEGKRPTEEPQQISPQN